MPNPHYHVMLSNVGCLPDSNMVFTSKDNALSYAFDLANESYYQDEHETEPFKPYTEDGFYILNESATYYIETTGECFDNCEDEYS